MPPFVSTMRKRKGLVLLPLFGALCLRSFANFSLGHHIEKSVTTWVFKLVLRSRDFGCRPHHPKDHLASTQFIEAIRTFAAIRRSSGDSRRALLNPVAPLPKTPSLESVSNYYVQMVAKWACGCQIRPGHHVQTSFIRRCEDSECDGPPNQIYKTTSIPTLCPECHDSQVQNKLRPLYGITGLTVSSIMAELDRVDTHRDSLRGADLAIRNQLETGLGHLDGHIIQVTRLFNQVRDVAMKAFFGEDLFSRLGWASHAEEGQEYPFIPTHVRPTPSMLTSGERHEAERPLYAAEEPVSNPVPPQCLTSIEQPPEYRSICPQNSLHEFEPADTLSNSEALEEGYSSDESDLDGIDWQKVELLQRVSRKLKDESKQLRQSLTSSNTLFTFSSSQQAKHNSGLAATSSRLRHVRQLQIKEQRRVIASIVKEDQLLIFLNKQLKATRARVSAGEASATAEVAPAKELLAVSINRIYRRRYHHSLSQLLIPLNGTDNSRAHQISLLPGTMAQAFATRVLGFPSYVKDQLQAYTSDESDIHVTNSDDGKSDEDDLGSSLSDGDAGDDEDDDWHGPSKSPGRPESGDLAQLLNDERVMKSQPVRPRPRDFVAVFQLRAYVVADDPEMPDAVPVRSGSGSVTFALITAVDQPATNTTSDGTISQTPIDREQASQGPSLDLQYEDPDNDDSMPNTGPRRPPLQISDIDASTRSRLLSRLQFLSRHWRSNEMRSTLPMAGVLEPSETEQILVLLNHGHRILGVHNLYATAGRLEAIRGLVTQGLPRATTTGFDVLVLIETIKLVDMKLRQEEDGESDDDDGTSSEAGSNVSPPAASRPPPSSIDSDTRTELMSRIRTMHEHFGDMEEVQSQLRARQQLRNHFLDYSEAGIEALPPGQLLRPSEIQQLNVLLEPTPLDEIMYSATASDDQIERESYTRDLVAQGLPMSGTERHDIGYLGFMLLTIHGRLEARAQRSTSVGHRNGEANAEDADEPMNDLVSDIGSGEVSEDGEITQDAQDATDTSQIEARRATWFRTGSEDDSRATTGGNNADDGLSLAMVAFDGRRADVRRLRQEGARPGLRNGYFDTNDFQATLARSRGDRDDRRRQRGGYYG